MSFHVYYYYYYENGSSSDDLSSVSKILIYAFLYARYMYNVCVCVYNVCICFICKMYMCDAQVFMRTFFAT
jgi:hypothetical protein